MPYTRPLGAEKGRAASAGRGDVIRQVAAVLVLAASVLALAVAPVAAQGDRP